MDSGEPESGAEKTANSDPKPTKTRVFRDYPAINKNNFKKYHEPGEPSQVIERNYMQRRSIYLTTPDIEVEQRIVNDIKPQVTIKYMSFRGKQYKKEKTTPKLKKQRLLPKTNN